jgi:hypothetical protein
MKKNGLIVLIIGIVLTLLTSFDFITKEKVVDMKEKVVDMGSVEISANKNHRLQWSPIIGMSIMALGFGLMVFGNKNK